MDDSTHGEGSVDVGDPVCMCGLPFWVWDWGGMGSGIIDFMWFTRR